MRRWIPCAAMLVLGCRGSSSPQAPATEPGAWPTAEDPELAEPRQGEREPHDDSKGGPPPPPPRDYYVGYWQTEKGQAQPPGQTFAPPSVLWLRDDGSYVRASNRFEPEEGWTVSMGSWVWAEDSITLSEQARVVGFGGQEGFEAKNVSSEGEDPTCKVTAVSKTDEVIHTKRCTYLKDPFGEPGPACHRFAGEELWRVGEAVEFDEAYYRRGCTSGPTTK